MNFMRFPWDNPLLPAVCDTEFEPYTWTEVRPQAPEDQPTHGAGWIVFKRTSPPLERPQFAATVRDRKLGNLLPSLAEHVPPDDEFRMLGVLVWQGWRRWRAFVWPASPISIYDPSTLTFPQRDWGLRLPLAAPAD